MRRIEMANKGNMDKVTSVKPNASNIDTTMNKSEMSKKLSKNYSTDMPPSEHAQVIKSKV